MKKNIVFFLFLICVCSTHLYGQTMHSILFTNMEEQGRELDRTAEMKQMTEFCNSIAESLGYEHNLRSHSGDEFTSNMLEKEIASLNVQENDVVIFYYAGHGCNWDDDNWPHMAFLDKQYWETTTFAKLKAVSKKAKLLLCIASCCNMDSEGRRKERMQYAPIDKERARKLFLGFSGKKAIIASSSVRGQYTYSWSSGPMLGSIYAISFRKTINEALSGISNVGLTWNDIFEATKRQTLAYTNNRQLPQYVIENNLMENIAITPLPSKRTKNAQAEIDSIWLKHNIRHNGVECLEIHVKLSTHFMDQSGGRIVALFESPKGYILKDKNNNYCTVDGQVSVGADFGSHYEHLTYPDITLIIPNEEIHSVKNNITYYIKLGVYDYNQNKYINFSDYVSFVK